MSVTFYLIPLAAVISMVYSATRYELPDRILRRAIHLFGTILGCMAGIIAVLWLLSFTL